MPYPFDLVALDMAGTTVDEGGMVYEALESSVAAATGQPILRELLVRWKGTSKREAITGLLADLDADASDARVDEVFADFTERLMAAYRDTPPSPIAGVPELFRTLRANGVKVALQTGYPAPIADSLLKGLSWTVGATLDHTVDAIVTSDLVPASRPAPFLVFRCMEATGVTNVARVLTAGDTPNDLGAGINAGAGFVVGVTTGSFARDALEREPHTHILDSLAELPRVFESQGE